MLVCRLVLLAKPGPINFTAWLFVVITMFAWPVVGSVAFLANGQPPNRKALATDPVFLFYLVVISWMIFTFTPQQIRKWKLKTSELKEKKTPDDYI